MPDYTEYPLKRRKPFERLEIFDCMEIILQDLQKCAVPESEALRIIRQYFVPLFNETNELKKEYEKNLPEDSKQKDFISFKNAML